MTTTDQIDRGIDRQLAHRRQLLAEGVTAIGWKAAFGAPAAQARLGLDGPLLGFMTERTVLENGVRVDVTGWAGPLAEPELAVWLGADLSGPVTEDEVREAVRAIGPAIELADPASEDVEEALAESGFHRGVILGERREGIDAADLAAEVVVDGEARTVDDVQAVTGPVTAVIAHLCRHLSRHDLGMAAGEVVICGALMPPVSFVPGTVFEYRLGDMQPVSVSTT